MHILYELGIIFLICAVGESVAAVLPLTIPSSVVSLVILLILLLTGAVRERSIQRTSDFLTENMGLFFVPALVGTLEYADVLKTVMLPFFAITLLTTPVVYGVTAWTVRLLMRLTARKEEEHV